MVTTSHGQTPSRYCLVRPDVSKALLGATDGLPLGEYFEGQTRVGLIMKLLNDDASYLENLENILVWSMLPDISALSEQSVRELLTGQKSMDELTGSGI